MTLLHELRSPLSSIAGSADYLRSLADRTNIDISKLRRIAEQITVDVEAAQQLAERQYELRNPTSTINVAAYEASAEVRDAVQRYGRVLSQHRDQELIINVPNDLGAVLLDRRGFRQVIYNLLENAFRFGYRTKPIEVAASRAGSNVIVRIRNYGLPVEADHEELIFQPFYTGSSTRGPGLGLFVARKVVKAMGGELRLTRHADPVELSIYLKATPENARE